MRNEGKQEQALLNEIGGEPLEGSGFEDEIPDPSVEIADPNPQTEKPRRFETKEERRHAE